MDKVYRILAVNPGSTSTKTAVFENERQLFSQNVHHDAEKLKEFPEFQDQLPYRKETIEAALSGAGISLESIDVYVGRGGGLVPCLGGTYAVTERLVADASVGASGAPHPAQLGSQICWDYARRYGKSAFVVNPPDTDEYSDLARVTGFSDLYRRSHVHALNHKEVALRYCAKARVKYDGVNLVVCHIGGGVSVAAHQGGRMVDSNDLIGGEGPMMPTRSGSLPAVPLVKLAYSGKYTERELITRINKNGGLIDHLGTADAIEIEKRIAAGDRKAKAVYDAMIYEIAKCVGACACAMKGEVEAILLTGGISHSKYVTAQLAAYTSWIAPVEVLAGEFEMEALAAGALRVMRGAEEARTYTGVPVWSQPE
ncbi:Butyrate kinase 2 [uncultured Eubacteriales bacterium]|uniref:Probable butyrate kinase n=1 Tax=uncultured Eubacteriales bacterium TaxID=172733 RepID=A0A212JK54_9FIRM|nr:Butyrate kinase 2 [uncultured Eubacteriales bacterium]